jgi:hypothetical protein
VTCPRGRPVFLPSSTAPGGRATPASEPAGAPGATAPPPGQDGRGRGRGGPGGGHGSDG